MAENNDTTVEAIADAVEVAAEVPAKATKVAEAKSKMAPKRMRKAKASRPKPQRRAKERNEKVKNDTTKMFTGFNAFPSVPAFEKLFADAAGRSEEAVKRSRKAAEEFAELYRGNLDAFVEAGKIAATGAQSIGQDIAAKSRDSLERTANTVRSFAEAKSPTELLQLQSDFARTAFDRFVEESSNLTESVVKLAGEAFQPISNRASANVEKLNTIAA